VRAQRSSGRPYIGSQIKGLNEIRIPILSDLPVAGTILFHYDILVYLVVPIAILVWWALFYTRWGLSLRAVGEKPTAVFAAGRHPYRLQYEALFVAGLLGGIAGAYLSLAVAKTWAEWMTAGRGFVAVALVIFSKWHPASGDRRSTAFRRRDRPAASDAGKGGTHFTLLA